MRGSLAVGDSCRTQGSQCEPGKRIDDAGFESIHGVVYADPLKIP